MSTQLPPALSAALARCDAYAQRDPAVWLHRLTASELAFARSSRGNEAVPPAPLAGLTFAIKDNIDLAGIPTTAACPGFAFTPAASAYVVQNLLAAGALPLGKTNLDQFATGLVGTRSPHGAPRNVFNSEYISGGSSSGSAVAVAAGLVDFALGTDTAGSGRVPAAFNGIIGLKPTRGRLSTRGVVPACRSLDCVSIFARDLATAGRVLTAAEGFDHLDPFSRSAPRPSPLAFRPSPKIGVPRADQLDWFGNPESPALFASALDRLRALGIELIEVDFAPFLDAARLLYEGPWTAERYAAVGAFIEQHSAPPVASSASAPHPAGLDPVVAQIILGGRTASAADAFRATYRLAELRRAADTILATVDALVAPTAGTIYKISEIAADPIRLNSNLGRYNNFMNLLDLCGLTVPAGRYSFGPGFGITFIAPAWHDEPLLALASRYLGEPLPPPTPKPTCHLIGDKTLCVTPPASTPSSSSASAPASPPPASPTPETSPEITLAVCGAHLRGQPLHAQLTALGARFLSATTTAPVYRLYALPNTTPTKPGLVRVPARPPSATLPDSTPAAPSSPLSATTPAPALPVPAAATAAPIAVETYSLSPDAFGRFTAAVPPPLVIGNVELIDGTWVKGFLCEPHALHGATDITSFGGWIAWRNA